MFVGLRADERFGMLDAMEAEDGESQAPVKAGSVDLGLTAKVRPCLVLSDYPADNELALIMIVPHTTPCAAIVGSFRSANFFPTGVFHLWQIQPVSLPKAERRLGVLSPEEFRAVGMAIVRLLHLAAGWF